MMSAPPSYISQHGAPRAAADNAREERIELRPDAWEQVSEFLKRIAKAGPQHGIPKDSGPCFESKYRARITRQFKMR